VILDIQIPGISGLDVIHKVREKQELKDLKVIAVTAYSMRGDREKILEAGCNEYVSKPINTREFPNLIRSFLND
jgi:two-component system cell cycle response regulator DivK